MKVLKAAQSIQEKLDQSDRMVIGYNCCWSLLVEHEKQKNPAYKKPSFLEGVFPTVPSFAKALLRHTKAKTVQEAVETLFQGHGYVFVDGLEKVKEGDVIIRKTPWGLHCSLVTHNKTEITVLESEKRILDQPLPLLDKTIFFIGRKEQ